MVRPCIALTLAGLILVSACSPLSPPDAAAPSPKAAALTERRGSGVVGGGNRVSEVPWWQQQTADPPTPDPVAEPEPLDASFELSSDVLFKVGSAELGPAAASQLNHLVGLAEQHPNALLEIAGHTDSTPGPTRSFNDELSLERAESVESWLVQAGVAPERITVEGRGANEPAASNETEAGRAANRRVTITVAEPDA